MNKEKNNLLYKCLKDIIMFVLIIIIAIMSYGYMRLRDESDRLEREALKAKINTNKMAYEMICETDLYLGSIKFDESIIVRLEASIYAIEGSDLPYKDNLIYTFKNIKDLYEIEMNHPGSINREYLYEIESALYVTLYEFASITDIEFLGENEIESYNSRRKNLETKLKDMIGEINGSYNKAMSELKQKDYEE